MRREMDHIAVLTGDLVASTALGARAVTQAFAVLERCALAQEPWMGASLRFSRHRGDGWQAMLAKPHYALRAALTFRAALRAEDEAFDSYLGIAEGPRGGDIGPDLNAATSEVFVASGTALEMAKTAPTRLIYASNGAKAAAFALADHISRDWTPAQAAAVGPQLPPGAEVTYTDIARALGKSRQSVTKSSQAAGMEALAYAMLCYESDTETANG